jgi:hypothetical protein
MSRALTGVLPPEWPAELRLLVVHLRLALGTSTEADREFAKQPVDWAAWLRWMERHRVGAFLHHRLPAEVRAALPEEAASRLRGLALDTARRSLGRIAELARLVGRFEQTGIRLLSVKGPALAQRLYGEAGLRHAGDLDLLIAPEDARRADQLMREAGYYRAYPDFELTPLQWEKYLELRHELKCVRADLGLLAEVQWRLEGLPQLRFADLWERRVPGELAGARLALLPEPENALYLFVHGARHGWSALFWLVDIALLLAAATEADATALLRRAQSLGASHSLLQGAALARDLLGVKLPALWVDAMAGAPRVRWLVSEARRRMVLPQSQPGGAEELFRRTWYALRLPDELPLRAGLWEPRLLSPVNWKVLPLPDRWFWLYYPAAPLLWAWRRLRLPEGRRITPPVAGGNPPPATPRTP